MENRFLSEREKNSDIEYMLQNKDQFFDTVNGSFKSRDEKSINKICTKLTNLYKDKDARFQSLIINCIPILLKNYFTYFYDEKICSCIEVCILTVYNLSLIDENLKSARIRIPNLSQLSVYHSPHISSIRSELSESALSKLEKEYVILEDQFKPYLDTINAEKRLTLIRFLIMLYHSRLAKVATRSSKVYFCDVCQAMCKPNRTTCKTQPIYLSSPILAEMLFTLFYLFNNSLQVDATKAIDAIYQKASNDLLPDILLMCNSMKNIMKQIEVEEPSPTTSDSAKPTANSSTSKSQSSKKKKSEMTLAPLTFDPNVDSDEQVKSSSSTSSFANTAAATNATTAAVAAAATAATAPVAATMLTANAATSASLADPYQSPTWELRSAARRASIKLQQQQDYVQQKINELVIEEEKKSSSPSMSQSQRNSASPPLPTVEPKSASVVDDAIAVAAAIAAAEDVDDDDNDNEVLQEAHAQYDRQSLQHIDDDGLPDVERVQAVVDGSVQQCS